MSLPRRRRCRRAWATSAVVGRWNEEAPRAEAAAHARRPCVWRRARAHARRRVRPRSRPRPRRRAGRRDRGQPALAGRQHHAHQRRHRHRLRGHAGHLLARAHAAPGRGPLQPLLRHRPRDALRVAGPAPPTRYFVIGRETLYESPVALTPYSSDVRIDERAIGELIDDAYGAAGIHPDEVDTGSGLLTGEAPRRENAQAIGDLLAEMGGEFVCATAGHHMEAMLAAYGSGAAKRSHDEDKHILNVDIGGGTTKLALVAHGKVEETAAIHIGGRLVVVDEAGRITRLDPQGAKLARAAGYNWQLGRQVARSTLERLTDWLADTLLATIPARRSDFLLTEPLRELSGIDGVMFSGGVAEYVYGREERDFGDLGRGLGYAIRNRVDAGRFPWRLLPAGEC